ncbi:MAG: glycosyltransferase family 2 protein [Deltaproteobacteria bacterium]|nr:glycosyltransferase family 2 protein [Myxococcales bacterium]MDP3217658.1 glycosyltransferase family 2 protein [Deltaproteobacteria bacterium]
MALITVLAPCFNEEGNVSELYAQVGVVFEKLPEHRVEFVFIDNCSTDGTVAELRALAAKDRAVKVILNVRNFGQVRSPYHALLQCRGDAVITLAADLQDPPALIPELLEKWREGYKIVAAVKRTSDEGVLYRLLRGSFYALIHRISDVRPIQNFTGFGLYDQVVIEALRKIDDPQPYFRGLISEIGWPPALVPFDKPRRVRGVSKNNFFTLYDLAILGIVKHSVAPLRLATFVGFIMSGLSLLVSLGYLVAKLVFWSQFTLGTAPILIGFFFFASVQLFFIGILGEYINSIHIHVRKLPLVVERERINWEPATDPRPLSPEAPPPRAG